MPPKWNLFVKIATITKGELAPMATFGINFISLVQKYGVGGWFWFRCFMTKQKSCFFCQTNITYRHSCFERVASVDDFPFDGGCVRYKINS